MIFSNEKKTDSRHSVWNVSGSAGKKLQAICPDSVAVLFDPSKIALIIKLSRERQK